MTFDPGTLLATAAFVVIASLAVAIDMLGHRRRERATAERASDRTGSAGSPRPVRPAVDGDRCIGCLSCLRACPEDGALGWRDGSAELAAPDRCTGCGTCVRECPAGAISLVLGSRERPVLLPELDPRFESSRPGIHVVGELAGAPLIKDSALQGLRLGEILSRQLDPARAGCGGGILDVAIVGAGPAGLAAAFALHAAGRSYLVLDRESALSTVRHYPQGKHVFTDPVSLPRAGGVGAASSRDAFLGEWLTALERGQIALQENTAVTAVRGEDGAFEVVTSSGALRARKVVLAVGRSGSPSRLGVAGEDLPRVTCRLEDPNGHRGQRVLVVGGGDTAVEAAIQLATAGAREVTLVHRGSALTRCSTPNREAVEGLAARGHVRLVLRSRVLAIEPDQVKLQLPDRVLPLRVEAVVVAIGSELPIGLLRQLGLELRRYSGEPAPRTEGERPCSWPRLALAAATLCAAAALAALLQLGWRYYRLAPVDRLDSPLHATLRPAGRLGIATGFASAALLLSTLAYSARKRWSWLRRGGPLRPWLHLHAASGAVMLLAVGVHSAFATGSALAALTRMALFGTVVTGFIGSHLYGRVRTSVPVEDPRDCAEGDGFGMHIALPGALEDGSSGTDVLMAGELRASMGHVAVNAVRLKAALAAWRPLHLALATFLLVAATAHVAVVIYLGYASP